MTAFCKSSPRNECTLLQYFPFDIHTIVADTFTLPCHVIIETQISRPNSEKIVNTVHHTFM
jgi:hypothetical protein